MLTSSFLSRKPKHHPRTEANCNLQSELYVWLPIYFSGAGRNGSGGTASVFTGILHCAPLHTRQLQGRDYGCKQLEETVSPDVYGMEYVTELQLVRDRFAYVTTRAYPVSRWAWLRDHPCIVSAEGA